MPNLLRLPCLARARRLSAPYAAVLWWVGILLLAQPVWAAATEPASSAPASSAPASSAPASSVPASSAPASSAPASSAAAPASSAPAPTGQSVQGGGATTEPGAPRVINANAEVTRARQLFQERKFAEAAQALQRAYAVEPNPLFLFNAGQAYRKAEQRKEALEMYQRYLEVDEKGQLAPEARGYVSDLQAFMKAQERLQDAQVELETKESQAKKTQEALKIEKERALFMEQALKKETNKPFYKKNWFYAVAGIGGFILVAGLATAIAIPLRLDAEAGLKPTFSN